MYLLISISPLGFSQQYFITLCTRMSFFVNNWEEKGGKKITPGVRHTFNNLML